MEKSSGIDFYSLKKDIDNLYEQFSEIKKYVDLTQLEQHHNDLQQKSYQEDFWSDQKKAKEIMWELTNISKRIDSFKNLDSEIKSIGDIVATIEPDNQNDIAELSSLYESIYHKFKNYIYLNIFDSIDEKNAVMTIKPGAGGLEATDWALILYKMYMHYFEIKKLDIDVIEYVPYEGGGLKSATILVKGLYAYGLLKYEVGIHRLVRISPFDSNQRRHTSFASVYCYPEISEEIEVTINPDDIKIDTYRAGGAGGQHVNKTDSAVRITHLPTKIVVTCQNERSQFKNKETALKILKSRLYQYYLEEQKKHNEENQIEKEDISWGNQLRSYTLQPYSLVKDHRTKYEIANYKSVFEGNIDPFIFEMIKLDFKNKYKK